MALCDLVEQICNRTEVNWITIALSSNHLWETRKILCEWVRHNFKPCVLIHLLTEASNVHHVAWVKVPLQLRFIYNGFESPSLANHGLVYSGQVYPAYASTKPRSFWLPVLILSLPLLSRTWLLVCVSVAEVFLWCWWRHWFWTTIYYHKYRLIN